TGGRQTGVPALTVCASCIRQSNNHNRRACIGEAPFAARTPLPWRSQVARRIRLVTIDGRRRVRSAAAPAFDSMRHRTTAMNAAAPPATETGTAADRLFAALYRDLHRMARRQVFARGSRAALGATTLLHE